jgi:hypothetical protein
MMSNQIALQEKLSALAASDLLDVPRMSPMYSAVNVFCAHVETRNFSDAHKAFNASVEFDDTYYAAGDQTKHTVRVRQRARKVLNQINALSHDNETRRELEALRSTGKVAVKS